MFHVKQKKQELINQIKNLPKNPGVYKFFDINNKIIYIGKAKNLKNRVSSYFNNKLHDSKTQVLVSNINKFEFVVVNNENDALLLESNLIKQFQPKYNILLKDDKTYPWICVTNDYLPKVFKTRNIINKNYQYFGPYSSGYLLVTVLELINKLFKLRSCKLNLTAESIEKNQHSACLEYQIGNCLAPCIKKQSAEEYNSNIKQVINILKGNLKELSDYLTKNMYNQAAVLEFEKANETKKKLELLKYYYNKSIVTNSKINNVDIFSIETLAEKSFVNYLKINEGRITQVHNIIQKHYLNENNSDLLIHSILRIRELFNSNSNIIIVPFKIESKIDKIKFVVPKKGEYFNLLKLSEKNLKFFINDYKLKNLKTNYSKRSLRLLEDVKKTLNLNELPVHIECFDNSNIQGSFPVSSCVVFKDGKPSNKDYRHFNVKTVKGPNDFATMTEVVERRYKRLIEEKQQLPQLILIDGGKGQLMAAYKALQKLNLTNKITLISIAKRLEEIFKVDEDLPLYINKKSEVLKLFQRLRDEAHRFAITFHRTKRSNNLISSKLSNIKGFGTKTIQLLLKKYKSIDSIKNAKKAELESIIGKTKCKLLCEFLKNN